MLPNLNQMEAEWEAWQDVCKELLDCGIDINDGAYYPLVGALKLWGEELADLRYSQPPSVGAKAKEEAEKEYKG